MSTPVVDELGPLQWTRLAAQAAEEKLGTDTVIINVGPLLAVTEYFVISSGANARQVKAIVDDVEEQVAMAGGPRPIRVEGADKYDWVLLDYGPFVVHVFNDEQRAFYKLDRLWSDCEKVDIAG